MSDAEEVIVKALRTKNLTVLSALEPPKDGEEKLDGQSVEFLRGYHAAMTEIASRALHTTTRLHGEHMKAKATLFGRPSAEHHRLIGGGRVSKELGNYAFERAQVAFARGRAEK